MLNKTAEKEGKIFTEKDLILMRQEMKRSEKQESLFEEGNAGVSLNKLVFPIKTSEKLIEFAKNPKNFLVFMGDVAIGKIYFCAALVPKIFSRYESINFLTEEKVYQRIMEKNTNFQENYLKELCHMMENDWVIIDDLGAGKLNEWQEEVLSALIDIRYRSELPTVFTTNLTKEEFRSKYCERICSRFFATENLIIKVDLRTQDM